VWRVGRCLTCQQAAYVDARPSSHTTRRVVWYWYMHGVCQVPMRDDGGILGQVDTWWVVATSTLDPVVIHVVTYWYCYNQMVIIGVSESEVYTGHCSVCQCHYQIQTMYQYTHVQYTSSTIHYTILPYHHHTHHCEVTIQTMTRHLDTWVRAPSRCSWSVTDGHLILET